jgi:hypothetical protein
MRQLCIYKKEGKKEKYKDRISTLYPLFIRRRANIYLPVYSHTVTLSPIEIHGKYHLIVTPNARLVQKITKKTLQIIGNCGSKKIVNFNLIFIYFNIISIHQK